MTEAASPENPAKPVKAPTLVPIFLIVFVDVLGLTMILPLLPFYSMSFGATPMIVGLLASVYGLCQLISGPFLGQWSDRVGRKPILLISQLGTLAGFILLALSKSITLVFISRAVDGLTAGNIVVAQAYASDVTPPKDRTRAFGIFGAAFGLGFLIGPAISGFLAKYGNQYPIWAAAGLSFTSICATLILLKGGPPPANAHSKPDKRNLFASFQFLKYFRDPKLAPWLWQFFAFAFAFSLYVSGLALFSGQRFTWNGQPFGAQQVGYVFAYSGFLGLIIQAGLIRRLAARFGERTLIIAGFLSMAIGYFGTGQSYHVPLLLLFVTFNSAGAGLLRPSITSMLSQNASPQVQGAIMGVAQSLQSVAQIIAPLISGFLIDQGWLTGWATVSSIAAASGFFGLLYARSKRRRSGSASA